MKNWIVSEDNSNVERSETKWFKCNQIYL
jgi:hypothetical protein